MIKKTTKSSDKKSKAKAKKPILNKIGKAKNLGAKKPNSEKIIQGKDTSAGNGKYLVSVSVNEQVYKTKTDNIENYISSLGLNYLKTKTVLTVSNGKKTVQKVLMNAYARRMFINKMTAYIVAKGIRESLGEKVN